MGQKKVVSVFAQNHTFRKKYQHLKKVCPYFKASQNWLTSYQFQWQLSISHFTDKSLFIFDGRDKSPNRVNFRKTSSAYMPHLFVNQYKGNDCHSNFGYCSDKSMYETVYELHKFEGLLYVFFF